MAVLADITKGGRKAEAHRPWPRFTVDTEAWRRAVNALLEARATLLGLWGDKEQVHLALLEEPSADIAVVTLECPDGKFPSIGVAYPPAIRLERAIRDLYGLKPAGAADTRAWLDLGFWGVSQPLGANKKSRKAQPAYAFLPVEGEDLHQIPVGPVHAGIIEPGHFRFTANGEAVVRLEQRLGYVHKGIDGLMTGADLDKGAKLAGRVSGDSTVAYAWAYAQALEAIASAAVPPRASWLRALALERERIANHLGDLGYLGNDGGFAFGLAQFSRLKEQVLRSNHAAFGHRFMMDHVVPGGVARDLAPEHAAVMVDEAQRLAAEVKVLREIYDEHDGLQDRFRACGRVRPDLAVRLGLTGMAARASGQKHDLRCDFPHSPWDALGVRPIVHDDGDVAARVAVRFDELDESLRLVREIVERLPGGDVVAPVPDPQPYRLGLGCVEGWRGPVLVALELGPGGSIRRCHPHDPSWSNWPVIEHAVIGNIVPDFPLINKSFNLSYSGPDL